MSPQRANVIVEAFLALLKLAFVLIWLGGLPLALHYGKHHMALLAAFALVWGITAGIAVLGIGLMWLIGRASEAES
jgi:hypothetical protein